jgi:subtilisin family serine protease
VTEPGEEAFDPRSLYGRVLAAPLGPGDGPHKVVIDVNLRFPGGRDAAARRVRELVARAVARPGAAADTGEGVDTTRTAAVVQYVIADLSLASIRELARLDRAPDGPGRAIYRIWPDFPTRALTNRSAATVKADAARAAFVARGAEIVWAVVDSGIHAGHPHFRLHDTLELPRPLRHRDYTGAGSPLTDAFGHGTHVAGIIAGELHGTDAKPVTAVRAELDHNDDVDYVPEQVTGMSGMAPQCKLVSYKVLDANGDGVTSSIITALQDIQKVNAYGRDLRVHGVNLSVGYPFDPEWFACGESPLCVEVTRLVQSGVVVVVAAGNTGYGFNQDFSRGNVAGGLALTINDPGNAEAAITVGSTHRDMPHRYGVSYFSSKGPTGDGRAKPDLVAPGERILSAAAGKTLATIVAKRVGDTPPDYVEDSGTSMAAAHVSGVAAAFLSIRREFIGRPAELKTILAGSATDLGRTAPFQGQGLVDLMRAIQSV